MSYMAPRQETVKQAARDAGRKAVAKLLSEQQ